MSYFKSKNKNIKLFILLGHHMWFCYKDTLFNFKLKANIYPIKVLSSVDDRNIYNNFLRFWNIHSLKSLFLNFSFLRLVLYPLVSLPTLLFLLSWVFHSSLSISVTSNFIFCLWMNESWDACLFHLAYFIWHSDLLFFSFHTIGFHPFWGCVLCTILLRNILQFSFPFMQCSSLGYCERWCSI